MTQNLWLVHLSVQGCLLEQEQQQMGGIMQGDLPWITHDGGGSGARIQQISQGRHRSCGAPRSQHLAVHGCLLEQGQEHMEGAMQGGIPGLSHHGRRRGAGIQRRSWARRAPSQRHPARRSRGRRRQRGPKARCSEDTGDSRDEQEHEAVGCLVWRPAADASGVTAAQ